MGIFYNSKGILKYYTGGDYKAAVYVEQSIVNYYRRLIPNYMENVRQSWPAHITVVRSGVEIPPNISFFSQYDNEIIDFIYSPIIHQDERYYWLNCFSNRLDEIRSELGLTIKSRITIPPDGYSKCYHITIGKRV